MVGGARATTESGDEKSSQQPNETSSANENDRQSEEDVQQIPVSPIAIHHLILQFIVAWSSVKSLKLLLVSMIDYVGGEEFTVVSMAKSLQLLLVPTSWYMLTAANTL